MQRSHFHFLIEAASREALTAGMRSLTVNLSKAITGGRGSLFHERYHSVQIKTARQARNTLAYVLNNWRRHREDSETQCPVDPFSSGMTFDGWSRRVDVRLPDGYEPLVTSPPRTALLKDEWRKYGLIDPYETPGPVR